MSTLQLHARVFALADKHDVKGLCGLSAEKYFSRLEKDFNVVEFLKSILDVHHLTSPPIQTLRDITSEVSSLMKDLPESYIACPILADCHHCGPTMAMQALQVRCWKCSRGRA
ncbi:uncharacterized protein P174DRAFT_490669, partial [Aspergillus novofumigatus IBT 16806]